MDNELMKKVLHVLHVIIDAIRKLGTALGKPFRSSQRKTETATAASSEVGIKGKWSKRGLSIGSTVLITLLGVIIVSAATGGPLITGDNPNIPDQVVVQNSSNNQTQTSQNGTNESSVPLSGGKLNSGSATHNSKSTFTPPIKLISTTTAVDHALMNGGPSIPVNLVAHVTDINNNPVNGGVVDFTIGGTNVGSATVKNGVATITGWTVPQTWYSTLSSSYSLGAKYDGTSKYSPSTGSNTLSILLG